MSFQVRQALREATDAAHRRLHHHPVLAPLAAATLTRAQYGAGLAALHGVHAAADRALAARWPERTPRAPLIAVDLRALGLDPDRLDAADTLPAYESDAALLGGRYVIDGSAFGTQSMLGNVRRTLGLDAATGASFFAGGTLNTSDDWRALLAALEGLRTPDERDRARAAAEATFAAVERWLDRRANPGPEDVKS